LVILFILVIFFINLTWKNQYNLYFLLQSILQVIDFALTLLCLAITTNKQIRFVAIGFLINTTCDISTIYCAKNLLEFSNTEVVYLLGLTLIAFSFIGMFRNFSDLKIDRWLNKLNSVQAQCVLWSFVSYTLLITAFCGILIEYNLLRMLPLQYLPSILIVFSALTVIISSIPARVLSAPFARIEFIIDSYMHEKEIDVVQKKQSSNIQEFKRLENFLAKSFEVLKEKNRVQQELHNFEVLQEKNNAQQDLFKCASQVAHDIHSPATAISMISKLLPELSEEKRNIIRNASQRINDIASNLLVKYKTDKENGSETHLKSELVSSLLDHLISEKRDQMVEKSIELVLAPDNNTYSCFANLESGKFKRVISNLINNAAEAIELKGIIKIILEKETTVANSLYCEEEHYRGKCSTVVPTVFTQARRLSHINDELRTTNYQLKKAGNFSGDMLTIKIIDNGKGIPEDTLLKIKQGIIESSKKEGQGIGISSAVQNIRSWGGSYDIQSKLGEGTTFIIKLPITEAPDWFQSKLEIIQGMNVVVLDDDHSIHGVWEIRFKEYIKNNQITLKHFHEPSEFIEYCEKLPLTKHCF